MLVSRNTIKFVSKRTVSTLYSPEYVLCQENKEKTLAKFINMQPVNRQTQLPSRKAAVLIPLCIMDGKVSLLYTLRTSNLKNHRGQVSFPGGMEDDADKNYIDTALRETHEELGVDPNSVEIWGAGKPIGAKAKTTVTPVIGCINRNFNMKDLRLNKDEVEEAFCVTLEDLCNPRTLGHTQFRSRICMPVFTGGKLRIWGLTAVITYMFLRCLLPSRAYNHQIKEFRPISERSTRGTSYYK